MSFEWHDSKDELNKNKHGLSFVEAQEAFYDEQRIVLKDTKHSGKELRYFCIGKTRSGGIATVRFTMRGENIRIIGAGYWREGRRLYEQHN